MDYINMTKRCVFFSSILCVFGLFFLCGQTLAESHTIKAPSEFYSIKLKQEERSYYGYSPFSSLSLTTEGWACSERYADTTINKIREINKLIQPLAEAQYSLSTLEKALIQMDKDKVITLSKSNVQNIVYRAIGDAIRKQNFSSERDMLERAENIVKYTFEEVKNLNQLFGLYAEDIFKHVDYGTPSSIWKVSKMEPDEPSSVVFVAQNCYQKQDIDAMVSAIANAARKLDEALKSYKDTRDKALALGK